jgi:hypothetical protein
MNEHLTSILIVMKSTRIYAAFKMFDFQPKNFCIHGWLTLLAEVWLTEFFSVDHISGLISP